MKHDVGSQRVHSTIEVGRQSGDFSKISSVNYIICENYFYDVDCFARNKLSTLWS